MQKKMLVIIVCLMMLFLFFFAMTDAKAATIEPDSASQIEFKATSLEEKNGKKQLTVEIWLHQLNFKGIDLRLNYDTSLLALSDVSTNELIDLDSILAIPSCFQFENGFHGYMDMFAFEQVSGELRTVFSILMEDEITSTNSYLIDDVSIEKQVQIPDFVLFGKLTFQIIGEGEITTSSLKLKEGATSPKTGIKVNVNGTDSYEAQSLFAFHLALASENANLSNLESNFDTIDEFLPDTTEYTAILLQNLKEVEITATLEDETATMKAKIPKVDVDGNIQYDEENKLIYEEIDIESGIAFKVPLNKLGEETIVVQIIVTAEDKETTKTYALTIERPYGTIRGSILLDNVRESLQSLGINVEYDANAILYETGMFPWEDLYDAYNPEALKYDDLELVNKIEEVITDPQTGEYEIKVVPGAYDLLLDKKGYLSQVIKNIVIQDGDVIELGENKILAGDVSRDGIVGLEDVTEIYSRFDALEGEENYAEQYDIGHKGYVGYEDVTFIYANYDQYIKIINYIKNGG